MLPGPDIGERRSFVPLAILLLKKLGFIVFGFLSRCRFINFVIHHLVNIAAMMNLRGKIKEIFDTQHINDRFSKREFVIEYADNPQYPQLIKFETVKERCEMLDDFKAGEEVDVQFNIRGRAWTNSQGATQYFNTLQAWRLDRAGAEGAGAPPAQGGGYRKPAAAGQTSSQEPPSWMQVASKDAGAANGNNFLNDIQEDDLPF